MQVRFTDRSLRRLAESRQALRGKLGHECGMSAMRRFGDLRAATTLEDLRVLPGECEQRPDHFVISLAGGGAILFDPIVSPGRNSDRRRVSWRRIDVISVCVITSDLSAHDARQQRHKAKGGVSR